MLTKLLKDKLIGVCDKMYPDSSFSWETEGTRLSSDDYLEFLHISKLKYMIRLAFDYDSPVYIHSYRHWFDFIMYDLIPKIYELHDVSEQRILLLRLKEDYIFLLK